MSGEQNSRADIEWLKTVLNRLFDVQKPICYLFDRHNSTTDYYWSGDAAQLIAYPGYVAKKELVTVNAGERLILKHWRHGDSENKIAYGAYDNDGKAYNGVSAGIAFASGVYDEVEDTYTFTIPEGCTLIGLMLQTDADHPSSAAVALVRDDKIRFTDEMNVLLEDHFGQSTDHKPIGDRCAEMFQKGASIKSYSPEKKPAVISAGQSNIDGRVPIAELPAEIKLPMLNCHYCSNYTLDHTRGVFQDTLKAGDLSETRWGFDLVTYYYLTQVARQELYVMKWSQGGTSIDPNGDGPKHWTPFYENLPAKSESLLWSFEQLIRACIQAKGHLFEIRAMIWHQGESDRASFSSLAAHHYYTNLKHTIAYCRGIVGNQRLPLICGTISHRSKQYDQQVDNAIRKLAAEDPYIYLIDMSGATLLDNFHFDASSSIYFGKCVYNQLIEAGVIPADNKPVSVVPPWE